MTTNIHDNIPPGWVPVLSLWSKWRSNTYWSPLFTEKHDKEKEKAEKERQKQMEKENAERLAREVRFFLTIRFYTGLAWT